MKEVTLRKWHRTAGIVLVLFIVIQSLSGALLSLEDLIGNYWGGSLQLIHYRFRPAGDVYRIILGIGLLWMSGTGAVIWFNTFNRSRRRKLQ